MFYAKVDVSIDTLHSKIGHQNCSFVVGTPLQPFTMAMPRGNSRIGQQLKCSSFPVEVCWEKDFQIHHKCKMASTWTMLKYLENKKKMFSRMPADVY